MPVTPWLSAVASAALAAATVGGAAAPPAGPAAPTSAAPASPTKVLVISVDALGSNAVRRLGPRGAPTLHRLLAEGAGTLEARTLRESTSTLPNHTTMVTGRRLRASTGGHGVWWNDDRRRPRTVQQAAGHRVSSVFAAVDSPRRHPGLFVSKRKLSLFDRSWPRGVDRFVLRPDNRRLLGVVRRDLLRKGRALTFVHLSHPDDIGHRHGFLSRQHLAAVTRTDRRIGRLLAAVESRPRLRARTAVVVTADHGGAGAGHSDPRDPADFRIPFLVWGAGVAQGADLYDLNPDYRDPGATRTRYGTGRPPVRNGDVANLVTDLLGLPPVRDSRFNAGQSLDVS